MAKKFLVDIDVKGSVSQTNATSSMLKADSTGKIVPAIAGVDYLLEGGGGSANNIQHDVKAGESISIGQAVYVFTADGTNIVVKKASNSAEATSSKTFGLIDRNAITNDTAKVVTEGLLSGLDTSMATAGDPVWLGTNGNLIFGLANKPTAPAHLVFVGIVTRAQQNNGEIFVKVQNGFETDELHDVIANGRTANQVLHWDGSINRYASITSLLGYTPYNSTNPSGYITSSSLTWANISSKPTNLSQFTNDLGNYGGWITGITSAMVINALGYTPYNSTNPSNYITSASLTWANISGKPTTLAGYGITDAASSSHNHNGTYWAVEGGWKPASLASSTRLIGKTSPDGGEFALAYSGGQIHAYTDGFFYQNEGAYRVLDTNSIGSYGFITGESIGTSNTAGVVGAKYQINNDWIRVNNDDRQFQIYGNARTLIYRTDGNSNPHGGGGYAHIFYYGGSADSQRCFIINTDGRLYSPYHGWLDSMSVGYASSAGSASNSSNTNSVSNATGGSYTWTGQQYFLTNNGGYAVNNSNSAALEVYSTGNNTAFQSFHRGGYWATNFGLDSDNWIRIGGWSAAANRFQFNAVSGDFVANGDITAFSDARVKENVITIDNALSKVLALRGVYYNRIDSEDKSRKIGVIAQETLPVIPEVVNQDAFGTYNVSYGNMGALFIEAFKEQNNEITALKNEVKELKEIVKYLVDGFTK